MRIVVLGAGVIGTAMRPADGTMSDAQDQSGRA